MEALGNHSCSIVTQDTVSRSSLDQSKAILRDQHALSPCHFSTTCQPQLQSRTHRFQLDLNTRDFFVIIWLLVVKLEQRTPPPLPSFPPKLDTDLQGVAPRLGQKGDNSLVTRGCLYLHQNSKRLLRLASQSSLVASTIVSRKHSTPSDRENYCQKWKIVEHPAQCKENFQDSKCFEAFQTQKGSVPKF